MIQPVNALPPKVLFKGELHPEKSAGDIALKKRIALINSGGLSIASGGIITAIARSYTSSWKHAGIFGVGAAAVLMMFLAPGFMYKSGINVTKKSTNADVFAHSDKKPHKLLKEAGLTPDKIKSIAKKAV